MVTEEIAEDEIEISTNAEPIESVFVFPEGYGNSVSDHSLRLVLFVMCFGCSGCSGQFWEFCADYSRYSNLPGGQEQIPYVVKAMLLGSRNTW